jgi:hypothetical protein
LIADVGAGSTKRNGDGSIATVASDKPCPAGIWAIGPPKECPATAGLRSSPPMAFS